MISILVVEDEAEKRRAVNEELYKMMSEGSCLDNCSTVLESIDLLKKKKYDLIILDINIPFRADKPPKASSGIKLLGDLLNRNLGVNYPRNILCLTAYDESLSLAKEYDRSCYLALVKFEYGGAAWVTILIDTINRIMTDDMPPYETDGKTYHTDVGIVCALKEEFEPLKELPITWSKIDVPHDDGEYYSAIFERGGEQLRLVAVVAPAMGMSMAGVATANMISSFRPRLVVMTGICAGVRSKTGSGDILVADPCFDSGSGKWVSGPSVDEVEFRPAPYQLRIAGRIKSHILQIADDGDKLRGIYNSYEGEKPSKPPTVLVDAMGSGGTVLQATVKLNDIVKQHKNLIGIEMETYAVYVACIHAPSPKPEFVSMKSVCDFGDEEKSNCFHGYAAHTSSQFAFLFIQEYLLEGCASYSWKGGVAV